MIIIIGLGNPSDKHKDDRHNVGWQVLDVFAEKNNFVFEDKSIFQAEVAENKKLLLVKPQTYMNDSGLSAKALFKQYKELPVVVYDDVDISLGEIKCSFARGAGGHNGVQSIIDHLGTKDFFRIRVGVRPVHDELQDKILPPDGFQNFLLKPFAPFEEELRDQGIAKAVNAIEALQTKTFEEVMNEYN